MNSTKKSALPKEYQALLDAATAAAKNSYSPYSGFSVGAAVLTDSGNIFCGTNLENAACIMVHAETAALAQANTAGERGIRAIAITAHSRGGDLQEVVAPCGSCRQEIFELSHLGKRDVELILANTKHTKIVLTRISELLPLAFGIRDLGVDASSYEPKKVGNI